MLSRIWQKGQNLRRLRLLLAGLFVALALPTALLIKQAFDQLKWESFYQYRVQAEEVTSRIDVDLLQAIAVAANRSFSDYAFVSAVSDNVVQRSPLAAYPVLQDVPGVVGYFQVSPDGTFSSPLLPDANILESGIPDGEIEARRELANRIVSILAENRLVRGDAVPRRQALAPAAESPLVDRAAPAAPKETEAGDATGEALRASSADFDTGSEPATIIAGNTEAASGISGPRYDQVVFDQLNQRLQETPERAADAANSVGPQEEAVTSSTPSTQRARKVQDLNLDDSLQKLDLERKREVADFSDEAARRENSGGFQDERRESVARPAAALPEADRFGEDNSQAVITTFQRDIDPFEFSMLDSGHFVLFRKVWRNGERFIQGALIDQAAFVDATIQTAFRASALSDMSDLVLAYEEDILRVFSGRQNASYTGTAEQLDGSLLYRSRLGAPLDRLELVYSINRLPPGPGAAVLGWTSLVIALVFVGGFIALYRLGVSQIRLAEQQQDFVSAVSHELKTPLTSIRMYGEMLKEGWVDEDKRRQYYDYIHDESERLTRLIANVLQLANISRNQPGIAMKPTPVTALLDQVESKVLSQAERAGFEISFHTDPDAQQVKIDIDSDCFMQIVINLVDNGIKFSRNADNKLIDFGTRLTSDGAVEFRVRDYGPGIPKNQIRKIFRLFYRSESELTRETVGTGIGLAIVHQLATAMQGSVDVRNAKPGAEFSLRFPVLPA